MLNLQGRTCTVRTGQEVFVGTVEDYEGKIFHLSNVRRIWYWEGAATLSQLAVEGTRKPKKCKFPCVVPDIYITDVLEVIPMTVDAITSINRVPVWEAKKVKRKRK